MAIIRIEQIQGKEPKSCADRLQPIKADDSYEFRDATEEELAFWNTLDAKEKRDLTAESYDRCFFVALWDAITKESKKAEKLEEFKTSGRGSDQNPAPQPPSEEPPGNLPPAGPPVME
jgi:hypothetical protein